MFKALINKIQGYFANKKLFTEICNQNNLKLDYKSNISEINILKEIFVEEVYQKHLPSYPNAIIVDIGAHYGYFSIYAAKKCNTNCKIIALEPSVNNRNNFTKNIVDNNITNTRLLGNAVGKVNQKGYLYHSPNSANHSTQSTNKKKSKVNLINIANIFNLQNIEVIDFLKMDCEGAEYESLMSCNDSTLAKIKCISLEFHDLSSNLYNGEKLKEFLIEKGFKISTFEYTKSNFGLQFGKLIATK